MLGIFVFNIQNLESFVSWIPVGTLKWKIMFYINLLKTNSNISINQIHLINSLIIYLLTIYYFFLFFIRKFDKYAILFLKLLGFGLFFWFSFFNIPVLSFRFLQYFDISIIFLIPYFYTLFKNKIIIGLIILISLIFLFINLYVIHCPFVLD